MGTGKLWSLVFVLSRAGFSAHRYLLGYRDVGWSRWTPPPIRRRPAAGVNYMNLLVVALARALEVLLDVLGQLEHLKPLDAE